MIIITLSSIPRRIYATNDPRVKNGNRKVGKHLRNVDVREPLHFHHRRERIITRFAGAMAPVSVHREALRCGAVAPVFAH